ncbi:MAG: hypothetical protein AB198_00120 [Parcubacteria bacterium C7867-003]|nr:MAG: hypothetical protein AB198_00120 [Parcubacteria bacterium C7867-003]
MEPNNTPMNNMPINNAPQNSPSQSSMPENKSSIGSIIGTIIVIAIIILGGLYFWGKRVDEAKMKQDLVSGENTETPTESDEQSMEANSIKSVNDSDDLNSIEADLKATNTTNLAPELE